MGAGHALVKAICLTQHARKLFPHLLIGSEHAGVQLFALFKYQHIADFPVCSLARAPAREPGRQQAHHKRRAHAEGRPARRINLRHLTVSRLQAFAFFNRPQADHAIKRNLNHRDRTVAKAPLKHQHVFLERIHITRHRAAHKTEQQPDGIQIEYDIQKTRPGQHNQQVHCNLRNRQLQDDQRNIQNKRLARQGSGSIPLPENDFVHMNSLFARS